MMVKMSKIKATTDSTILHTCPCILIINIITTQPSSSNLTYSLATDIIITILKMTKNYYRILELPENCNNEQIKKAYRKLAMQHHPVHTPLYRIKIQIAKKKPKKNSHKSQKPMQYSQTHRKEQLMIEMETPQNNNIHSHNDQHTPETNMHGKIQNSTPTLITSQTCRNTLKTSECNLLSSFSRESKNFKCSIPTHGSTTTSAPSLSKWLKKFSIKSLKISNNSTPISYAEFICFQVIK